ncbi:hypothetical protein F383_34015 [Gossypium arboreum]|uniref:Uncharacterized protein n=1 Tax=Gossypium arboreum TaxID=29729 RepID=A0A0B0N6A4_GOSAR|nr:hypothetical protein F383_34015 [Gossypium arboreum]
MDYCLRVTFNHYLTQTLM